MFQLFKVRQPLPRLRLRSIGFIRATLPDQTHALLEASGQGLTEYLVLLLLIAVISIGAAQTLGRTIRGKLQMAERHIEGVSLEDKN